MFDAFLASANILQLYVVVIGTDANKGGGGGDDGEIIIKVGLLPA